MEEQNFANHGKIVPVFHLFVLPVFVANFIWSLFRLGHLGISFAGIFGVLLAAALVVLGFEARLFALAVQDPVIRFGEPRCYEPVLPPGFPTSLGDRAIP